MRNLLLVFIATLLAVLSSNSNQENTNSENKSHKSISPSDTFIPDVPITKIDTALDKQDVDFLNLFTEYTKDSLIVLTKYANEIKNTRFEGRLIGRAKKYLFKGDGYSEDYFEYYACLKFPFTKNLVGLIIRTPCDGANVLSLYLYDLAKDKLSAPIHLAAQYGDMGVVVDRRATIYNIKTNLKIIIKGFNLFHDTTDYTKNISTDSTIVYEKKNDALILTKAHQDKKSTGSY